MFKKKKPSFWSDSFKKLPASFREAYQLQIEEHSGRLGLEAARMLFLLNGGALIALLALLGNLAGKTNTPPLDIEGALLPFALGLATVVGSLILLSAHTMLWTSVSLKGLMKVEVEKEDLYGPVAFGLLGGILLCASLGCALWGFTRAVGLYGEVVEIPMMEPAVEAAAPPAALLPKEPTSH